MTEGNSALFLHMYEAKEVTVSKSKATVPMPQTVLFKNSVVLISPRAAVLQLSWRHGHPEACNLTRRGGLQALERVQEASSPLLVKWKSF